MEMRTGEQISIISANSTDIFQNIESAIETIHSQHIHYLMWEGFIQQMNEVVTSSQKGKSMIMEHTLNAIGQ